MPSELQRIAQGLLDVLDEIPRVIAYLQRTAQKCRENAAFIATANNTTARIVALQLDEAARRCDEAAHYASRVLPLAQGWAEQMVSGGRAAGPRGGASGQRPDAAGGSMPPTSRRQVGDQTDQPDSFDPVAREILERLPARQSGDRTRGVWIDVDGQEQNLVSGVDDYTSDVDRFMAEHQIRIAPGADTLGSHVEVKFAMRMRRKGLTDEAITINNRPCPGPYGCHRNLWKFLPDGARLTVYGPNGFKRTYPE